MLDEKLKSHMECNTCWKTENCTYYQDVKDTIEKFNNTPLNIHFPLCKDHESYFYKMMNDFENSINMPKFKQEYDCIWVGKEE